MRASLQAILWWELRRPLYNLAVLSAGVVSGLTIVLIGSRLVQPGEDVIEPLAAIFGVAAYAIAANVLYCLGWITELLWSGGDTTRTAQRRGRVLRVGIWFSVALTLLPAVLIPTIWAVFGFTHAPD